MYCPECGKEIKESSKFCRYCGNSIEDGINEEAPVKNEKSSLVDKQTEEIPADKQSQKEGFIICSDCGKIIEDNSIFCPYCLSPVESDLKEETPIRGDKFIPNVYYAGFWRRVLSSIIDSAICSICAFTIAFILGFALGFYFGLVGIDSQDESVQMLFIAIGYLIGLIFSWLYFTLFESSSKQATLGKMAIGIIVTDLNGRQISFGKANGRYWGKIISAIFLGIGYVMAGATRKKQALHDILAETLVVMR